MSGGRTEYQDEYCGFGGMGNRGGSAKGRRSAEITPCSKSYEKQPVGGIAQAKAQAEAEARAAAKAGYAPTGLPAYDSDFVATVYSEADRGTHRVQPQWRDPRWSEEMRASNSTLYQPADRDPPNRNNFYVYRTTLIDPLKTSQCEPLSVPDVHKLRYMHNNYMTPDDWY